MSNYYEQLAGNRFGQALFKSLGLPTPVPLRRGDAFSDISGRVLLHSAENSKLLAPIARVFARSSIEICASPQLIQAPAFSSATGKHGVNLRATDPDTPTDRFAALVFDASTLRSVGDLVQLHHFFQPVIRQIAGSGRIILLGRSPEAATDAESAAVSQALEGFCRSIAKEIGKRGATANLIQVAEGAEHQIPSALDFLLSARSAYVDGQVIRVSQAEPPAPPADPHKPLAGQTALVTGASRGIGASIARTLHARGAKVIGLDVESAQAELEQLAAETGGSALLADITSATAPEQILAALQPTGGVQIVVHNAGITRDKMLANMPEAWWTSTLDVNLGAVLRINRALLDAQAIPEHGRIIGVSSMNGIAGQVGQSNYAASKAGTIGWVRRLAAELQERNITVNAVAPGFIETRMTDAIPLMTREIGRRMNSLSQGGKPVDVAEAIAFFADPASSGINGNVLRVCGQCVVGA